MFERLYDVLQEARRDGAVHDAMIGRKGHVHHRPDRQFVVLRHLILLPPQLDDHVFLVEFDVVPGDDLASRS